MLVQDAARFLLRHYQIVATWPLQIYSSAIVFSPQTSVVRSNNLDKLPAWLRKLPQMEDSWASLMQTLAGHSGWVTAVAFSPDGKQIASGSHDMTIKLWDARTGDLQKMLAGHSGWVTTVAFSPDGKQIASGSGDKMIKLWDARTGDHQKTLAGHSDWVTTVIFSPDGKQIASGSYDETIKLWDVANVFKVSRLLSSRLGSYIRFRAWQEIKTFQQVHSLKFTVGGRHLLTNLGVIKVESSLDKQSPDFKSLEYLWVKEQWIYYGVVPIFLLAPDFKPQCYDVRGDQVTIGFSNGRVLSFDIDRISLNSIFKNSV
jgi:WD40 repeat protein